jgi:GR25 family glycosyltransferase involved in LPS biosynthesis
MRPIKVISLERSTDRRAAFARRNGHLAFEFFNAVDGAALTREAVAKTGLFAPGLDYTAGAHGVALSHHALWQEAIAAGEPRTIAEDDAIFREDFAQAHQQLLSELQPGWDFVLWGWNFDSILSLRMLPGMPAVMAFDHVTAGKALAGFPFTTARPAPYRLEAAFGLPAYTISANGARKLTSRCFPLANFPPLTLPILPQPVVNRGIDAALTSLYAGADCYVSFPPLAATPNDQAASTIQNGQYLAG